MWIFFWRHVSHKTAGKKITKKVTEKFTEKFTSAIRFVNGEIFTKKFTKLLWGSFLSDQLDRALAARPVLKF